VARIDISSFPPLPDPPRSFPTEPPLTTSLADLSGFWLRISCERCKSDMNYPLRLLAAERGWRTPLRAVLPLFKCSKCGKLPSTIDLIDSAQTGPNMGVVSGEPNRLRLI
jgi:hypothetical protein